MKNLVFGLSATTFVLNCKVVKNKNLHLAHHVSIRNYKETQDITIFRFFKIILKTYMFKNHLDQQISSLNVENICEFSFGSLRLGFLGQFTIKVKLNHPHIYFFDS